MKSNISTLGQKSAKKQAYLVYRKAAVNPDRVRGFFRWVGINLDNALSLAAALEDEEIVRMLELRK